MTLFTRLSVVLLVACAHHPAPPPPSTPTPMEARAAVDPAAIVAAPDRSADDRALDDGRHPAELLATFDLRIGDRVADLMAGGGYTTELLARAVGPTGTVYGQNSPLVLQRFAEAPWSARLQKPVNANVVRLDRELDDPLGDVTGLDAVALVLFYHDAVWQGVDRGAMNAAVFRALRPGGRYVVVDHVAREGAGLADVETLHRIDPAIVRQEVEAAGFRLVAEPGFLRAPDDTKDWSTSPRTAGEKRGTSDRVVLVFERPR